MPFARYRLDPKEWPAADRTAWAAARRPAALLDEPGLAAHWTRKTTNTVCRRYGIWIAWLRDTGRLRARQRPERRITREALSDYIASMKSRRLSPVTIAGYIRDLREAIRVMCPGADLTQLDHVAQRLDATAHPTRHKATLIVPPTDLVKAGMAVMRRYRPTADNETSRRAADRYRDALIITLLAHRPVRLANLAAMEIGRHLDKRGPLYWCRFAANETKNHRVLEFPLPATLSSWMGLYLDVWRPLLLRGETSNRLWITIRATPMTDNTIYSHVRHLTQQQLGRPINPHLFRDCAATFIAEQAPDQIHIVARILGHDTLRSSEAHYNQAGMLSAQTQYLIALAAVRDKSSPHAKKPGARQAIMGTAGSSRQSE